VPTSPGREGESFKRPLEGKKQALNVPWKGKRAIEDGKGVLKIRCAAALLTKQAARQAALFSQIFIKWEILI
jgi:hypothetical protein